MFLPTKDVNDLIVLPIVYQKKNARCSIVYTKKDSKIV